MFKVEESPYRVGGEGCVLAQAQQRTWAARARSHGASAMGLRGDRATVGGGMLALYSHYAPMRCGALSAIFQLGGCCTDRTVEDLIVERVPARATQGRGAGQRQVSVADAASWIRALLESIRIPRSRLVCTAAYGMRRAQRVRPPWRAPEVGDETPASNGRTAAWVPLVLSRGGRRGDTLGPSGSLRWGQSIL